MFFDPGHDVARPFQGCRDTAGLFPVLSVSFNTDAEFVYQTVPMTIIVRHIMTPVAVKGQAEVADFQMARGRDEEIVWFDISVDAFQGMGFLDADDHLSNVKTRHCLVQDVFSDQETQKVTTRHIFHHEIEVCSVLEAGDKRHDPGIQR